MLDVHHDDTFCHVCASWYPSGCDSCQRVHHGDLPHALHPDRDDRHQITESRWAELRHLMTPPEAPTGHMALSIAAWLANYTGATHHQHRFVPVAEAAVGGLLSIHGRCVCGVNQYTWEVG